MSPPRKPRVSKAKQDCKFHCCAVSDERKAEIAESVKVINVPTYGPACHCGLRGAKEVCPRHGECAGIG